MSPKQNADLEKFAVFLKEGTIALFMERGELSFSKPPVMERKTIIEYQGRMRADGMEKFDNQPTYVSCVNFYASNMDMQKKKTLGAMIVYVQQTYLSKLMRMLQYPTVDEDDEKAMLDSCGTLSNIVAGRFKSEVSKAGYVELEMSHFSNYRNSALDGVSFSPSEYDKFEIKFDLENATRLILEVSMGAVPRR